MMGRKRKYRKDLPERVYFRRDKYFFVDKSGKWHNLGADYLSAMVKYAQINNTRKPLMTIGQIMDRYQASIIPTKAPRTQKDNLREIRLLRKVFGRMRPGDVEPTHIYGYMDRRPPIRANREKALLSHIFSYAIRWGIIADNPCLHVKRNPEKPSGKYVEPKQYAAIYDIMPPAVQCAMDLALLTGLRQGDILRLKLTNCREDGLLVKTGKTGRELLFEWTDELSAVINRAKALPSKIASLWIIHTRYGQPYSGSGFRAIWQRHMRNAIHNEDPSKRLDIALRFAFKDLRTTAGTDANDDNLLGHEDRRTLFRHYKRKPIRVTPLR